MVKREKISIIDKNPKKIKRMRGANSDCVNNERSQKKCVYYGKMLWRAYPTQTEIKEI